MDGWRSLFGSQSDRQWSQKVGYVRVVRSIGEEDGDVMGKSVWVRVRGCVVVLLQRSFEASPPPARLLTGADSKSARGLNLQG